MRALPQGAMHSWQIRPLFASTRTPRSTCTRSPTCTRARRPARRCPPRGRVRQLQNAWPLRVAGSWAARSRYPIIPPLIVTSTLRNALPAMVTISARSPRQIAPSWSDRPGRAVLVIVAAETSGTAITSLLGAPVTCSHQLTCHADIGFATMYSEFTQKVYVVYARVYQSIQ